MSYRCYNRVKVYNKYYWTVQVERLSCFLAGIGIGVFLMEVL